MADVEESSPDIIILSESCFICNEVFSSDTELATHLIDHSNEKHFISLLAEKEKGQDVPQNNQICVAAACMREWQNTINFANKTLIKEARLRKQPPVSANTEPEVWKITSESDDCLTDSEEPKRFGNFRLVTPGSNIRSSLKERNLSDSYRLASRGGTIRSSTPKPKNFESPTSRRKVASSPKTPRIDNARLGVPKRITRSSSKQSHPFHCSSCSSQFKNIVAFQEHVLTHDDETRLYFCHICNKSFAYKGILRRHLYNHIRDKPRKHKICHKKFTHKRALRKHEGNHK